MQVMYVGKTVQSVPRFKFPDFFCLSANTKHHSNKQESIKVITEILVPFVKKQHQLLAKPHQATLLIVDVFHCQITYDVTSLQQQRNILLMLVQDNMAHIFQPLDLTLTNIVKPFLKSCFQNGVPNNQKENYVMEKILRK